MSQGAGKKTGKVLDQLSQPLKTERGICFLWSFSLASPNSQSEWSPFVLPPGVKENRWSHQPLNLSKNCTKPSVFLEGQSCVHYLEGHVPVCPALADITDLPTKETDKGTRTDVFNLIQQVLIQCLYVHHILTAAEGPLGIVGFMGEGLYKKTIKIRETYLQIALETVEFF